MSMKIVLKFEHQLVFLLDGFTQLGSEVLSGTDGHSFAHAGLHALPFLLFEFYRICSIIPEAVVDFLVDDGYHTQSILGGPVLAALEVVDLIEEVLSQGQFGLAAISQSLLARKSSPHVEDRHVHAQGELLHSIGDTPLADLGVVKVEGQYFGVGVEFLDDWI